MPSRTKKHSKSKLSYSDLTPLSSSSSSSSALKPNPDLELSEEELLSALEAASSKYPSLIGSSAFIGRILEDAAEAVESKGSVWLSESSMIASSITPGSIVSVSVASTRKSFSFNSPLSSLSDECARHFALGCVDSLVDEVGNYFALATVFPSCKVLRNGVRMSSSLSHTMGCPASGRIVFIYPIHSQSVACLVNGQKKFHVDNSPFLYRCKELYLALVSSGSRSTIDCKMPSQIDFPAETNHDQLENEKISSPKTPLVSQSKLSSPKIGKFSTQTYMESESKTANPFGTPSDLFDIKEVLGDESVKKLLQSCSASWLYSRSLLCGNLVSIPILSTLCIFQVIGANRMFANSNIQDLTDESTDDLFPQASDLADHVNDAFSVDHETKVYLHSHLYSAPLTPQKGDLQCLKLEFKDLKANAGVDFSKLGGLSKEHAVLKDIILSSAVKTTLSSLGLRPTKGVLLHGPPGTGKTSLARLCAQDACVNLFCVNGPEIISQYYGESEQALHEVFDSAVRAVPSVVFIDELDAIAPMRKDGGDELSQRMVATLLNLMDGISRTDGLLVIAATNRPDCIEPALRRPGRLDREIEIGVPSPKQRYDILVTLLNDMEHSLLDIDIQHLSMATHGFVGADLAALCNEAAFVCLRRYIDLKISSDALLNSQSPIVYGGRSNGLVELSYCLEDTIDPSLRNTLETASSSIPDLHVSSEGLNEANVIENGISVAVKNILRLTFEDFEKARIKVRPSAMREVILEVPKVQWEDIGGQKEVKTQLMEAVEWPQKHQDAFKRIGTRPPMGILMFGPPGCSKTLLARAVASEAGLNFLAVKGPELFSKWVGESEKAVRSLFAKARANAPSVIFFDEIDGLAIIRGKESDGVSVADRVMSQLLVELDGLHQRVNVIVIAATNRPDKVDSALLRPGRFDRLLYVGPPNETDREDIFRINLRRMPCNSDVCIKELAIRTDGYTGADISLICREAAVAAIEESLDATEITMKHLVMAIEQVQPSDVQSYQELSAKFQRLVPSTATCDDVGCEPCSSRSSWIPSWISKKSIVSRFWFLLTLSWLKSSSSG